MNDLAGKSVVVVGATSGIGEALVRRYAKEGAKVLFSGRRTDLGEQIASDLLAAGLDATFLEADASTQHGARRLAESVQALLGTAHALVLNAGVAHYGPLFDLDESAVDEMLNVNLKGPWLVANACHHLISDGGSILVTASVSSYRVYPGEGMYDATKAGVAHLVRAMAQELAPRRIRVNALCPGVVGEAGMSADAITSAEDPEALKNAYGDAVPLGRMAMLSEIADAAVFLTGDRSTYVTGTSLVVDGGLIAAP